MEETARALGKVLADEQDDESERRPHEEGDPPRVADGEVVDHEDEEERGDERAAPVRPVHGDVDPAPVLGRDELIDGRVDGRVLTTDAHAGDEAGGPHPVGPAVRVPEGQGGEHPTEEVHAQGDHEQVAPAELVRHPAEEEGADHLAEEVDGADGEGHLGGGKVQGLLLADEAFGVAGDGDLEAVQHPRHPERNDQVSVEPRPTQAVEPGRNQAPDRSVRFLVSVQPSRICRSCRRHFPSLRSLPRISVPRSASRYAPSVWACVNTGIGRVRCGLADFHSIPRCRN